MDESGTSESFGWGGGSVHKSSGMNHRFHCFTILSGLALAAIEWPLAALCIGNDVSYSFTSRFVEYPPPVT